MEEVREVWGGQVMDGLEGMEQNFKDNAKFDRKPVKLLENRCNVIDGWNPGDDAGGKVLNQLELMDGLVGETKEQGVAIIQTECDQSVYQDSSGVGSKGWTETVDVA